jgi:hypothetical protein
VVALFIVNIILSVHVELTLWRNKHDQSVGEDDWGFEQVLSLLLLIVPVRDFVASIADILEKVARDRNHLQQAINEDTFMGHDFQALFKQGANPKIELRAE